MGKLSNDDVEKVRAALRLGEAVAVFHLQFSDYMGNCRWGEMATFDGSMLLASHLRLVNAALRFSQIEASGTDEIIDKLVRMTRNSPHRANAMPRQGTPERKD